MSAQEGREEGVEGVKVFTLQNGECSLETKL